MVVQLTEKRFPLDLKPSIAPVFALYSEAKTDHWDPSRSIAWPKEHAAHPGAALVWSHRVWIGYGHLAEVPALLVRFCLEHRREADPKYFLSVRGTEEAWYVDGCLRMARLLGGFTARPDDDAFAASFDGAAYAEAMDGAVALEAYVAADVALGLTVECDQLDAAAAETSDAAAKALLERLSKTKRRHAAFGWRYLEARGARLDDTAKAAAAARLKAAGGAGSATIVPYLGAPALLVAAYEDAARDGLGAPSRDASLEAYEQSLAACRTAFANLGIEGL